MGQAQCKRVIACPGGASSTFEDSENRDDDGSDWQKPLHKDSAMKH